MKLHVCSLSDLCLARTELVRNSFTSVFSTKKHREVKSYYNLITCKHLSISRISRIKSIIKEIFGLNIQQEKRRTLNNKIYRISLLLFAFASFVLIYFRDFPEPNRKKPVLAAPHLAGVRRPQKSEKRNKRRVNE